MAATATEPRTNSAEAIKATSTIDLLIPTTLASLLGQR